MLCMLALRAIRGETLNWYCIRLSSALHMAIGHDMVHWAVITQPAPFNVAY